MLFKLRLFMIHSVECPFFEECAKDMSTASVYQHLYLFCEECAFSPKHVLLPMSETLLAYGCKLVNMCLNHRPTASLDHYVGKTHKLSLLIT